MKKLLLFVFCFIFTLSTYSQTASNTLIDAINKNDIKEVKSLIAQGLNINASNQFEKAPLHYAAYNGNLKIVKLLVENGADINAKYEGANPLYFAALANHPKIMKYLIKHGSKTNIKFENTPILFFPCMKCKKEAIEILLKNNVDPNITYGGLTMVELVATSTHCPLKEREKILKTMIKYGADINKNKGNLPLNALDSVIINRNFDVEELLVKLGAKSNFAIISHAIANNKEMISFLLENSFNINAKNPQGETALDQEITEDMKQFLISHGAKHGKDLN